MHLGGGEDRLQVHRLSYGAGFDVFLLKCDTDLLSGDVRDFWVDVETGEPMGRLTPRSFGLHGHAGKDLKASA